MALRLAGGLNFFFSKKYNCFARLREPQPQTGMPMLISGEARIWCEDGHETKRK